MLGSTYTFSDGSSIVIPPSGNVTVPAKWVSTMINQGFVVVSYSGS